MIRSIRFSLTLWYAAILIVILSLFGGVLYTNVRSNLARDVDRLLISEADGIGDAITSFGKAELEAKNPAIISQDKIAEIFLANISQGELPALVGRWAKVTDELDTIRPVRIVSPKGEILAFSPSLSNWLIPINPQALRGSADGMTFYETYRVADGHRVRIVTHPIREKGHSFYFVQVATSLLQTDASLEGLKNWLLWLIPSTAILASLIGWFLASLALRPVGKMIREARQMSESRLHQRIEVPKTGDELQKLGFTFNEMLDRFERGFKRLRQFSAAASHELRTPLTVMKGEIELVLRKPRTDAEYERVLRNQLLVVNDMARIVEQLLAVAHAEDGELAVQWETLELETLIRSVTQSFDPIAREKNISLQIVAEGSVRIQGERRLLERLIANLLENAIKHTPAGGRVTLEAVRRKEQSYLIVKDTGKGILAEELPKIFDKFFSPQHSSEGIPSTGIGLGLCRWIAEVHRGKIEVASLPGHGAEFTVFFPSVGS
ncbi:MAG: ATP-binding protein [Candidatus Omnitrophica bacterium]|nr:ATP-binding protein [Candidatus Omnitrophota bacterium]